MLDIFEQEKILDRAQQVGEQLQSRLRAMQADLPIIGEVRGLGPMAAIELVRDPHTREPAPEVTDHVVALARERGVLLIKAGLHGNVLRILAPLVIDDALLDHALDTLAGVIADATK